jgi:hypothetical protein
VIAKSIRNWLEDPENVGWLMVFDGADNLEDLNLQPYFPQVPNGHILISSRRAEAAQLGFGLKLECLDPLAGRELLMSQSQTQGHR